jgi:hypothetical protein
LVEPDATLEVLNGIVLPVYFDARMPVLISARRARDLRLLLRRADAFSRRGYCVEVLP